MRSINGNTWKLTFWILAHLIHRPALLQTVQHEVRAAIAAAENPTDLSKLLEGGACPATVAVYRETLRLTASSMGVRDVVAPVILSGGRQLRPGARLLIPFRQMLTHGSVWESNKDVDAETFDTQRFYATPDLRTRNVTLTTGRSVVERRCAPAASSRRGKS